MARLYRCDACGRDLTPEEVVVPRRQYVNLKNTRVIASVAEPRHLCESCTAKEAESLREVMRAGTGSDQDQGSKHVAKSPRADKRAARTRTGRLPPVRGVRRSTKGRRGGASS